MWRVPRTKGAAIDTQPEADAAGALAAAAVAAVPAVAAAAEGQAMAAEAEDEDAAVVEDLEVDHEVVLAGPNGPLDAPLAGHQAAVAAANAVAVAAAQLGHGIAAAEVDAEAVVAADGANAVAAVAAVNDAAEPEADGNDAGAAQAAVAAANAGNAAVAQDAVVDGNDAVVAAVGGAAAAAGGGVQGCVQCQELVRLTTRVAKLEQDLIDKAAEIAGLHGDIAINDQQIANSEAGLAAANNVNLDALQRTEDMQRELKDRNSAMTALEQAHAAKCNELRETQAALEPYLCTECDDGNTMVAVVNPCRHTRLCSVCINNFEARFCKDCPRRLAQQQVRVLP
jgi:hypothetical protein